MNRKVSHMAITFGATTIRAVPGAAARFKRIVVVLAIAVAAVLIAPYATANNATANDATAAPSSALTSSDVWTVAQGETLWSIGAAVAGPGESIRDTVNEIKSLNALESTALRVGDQLLVPVVG